MDITNSFITVFDNAIEDLQNMGLKPGENNTIDKDTSGIVAYTYGNQITVQCIGNPVGLAKILYSVPARNPLILLAIMMLREKQEKE